MATRFRHRVRVGLRSFVRRRAVDDELDAELQFHFRQLEAHEAARLRAADLARDGSRAPSLPSAARDDAYLAARRTFGGFDQTKEACRDMRTLRWLEYFLQDVRFGARLLRRDPVFTVVAVLSLALGIGANSAIFSLINGVMLRALPVAQADELYVADTRGAQDGHAQFAYPTFEDARASIGVRAEIAAASGIQPMQIATLSRAGGGAGHSANKNPQDGAYTSESARVQLVSGEYFGLVRQHAQVGRLLTVEDDRTLGQHPVAVISDGYWSRRFGRAHSIVGGELTINGAPFTIVGVTAPGFFGTTVGSRYADLWAPTMMQAQVRYAGRMTATDGDGHRPWPPQRGVSWLDLILRIPSTDVASVAAALNVAAQRGVHPEASSPADADNRRRLAATRVTLTPAWRGISDLRAVVSAPLLVLLAMVVLLLAITCANVASLLLARATNRHREMAIRLSIGAGRSRLVRQLLTESLLLALLGGGMGLLIAYWGLGLAHGSALANGLDVSQDWRVTGVTLAVSLTTGVAFGLLPALRSTQVCLADSLKSHTRGVIDAARAQPAKVLIAGQIAVSLFLLVVAALFARSLQELTAVDVGFDRDRLIVARVDPRAGGYAPAELPDLYRRVVERIRAIPGVTAASLSTNPPFSGSRVRSGFEMEGYTRAHDEQLTSHEERVTTDYFRTVGLRILQGRAFGPEATTTAPHVSVISHTMAQRYFPKQDAVGRRWGPSADFAVNGFEIVGVVEDARYGDLKSGPVNMVYLPAHQGDEYLAGIEIRTAVRPEGLVTAIRTALREGEPRLPVTFVSTLDERILGTMGSERLLTWLTTAFGAVALFLACLGLYGTISYAVTRRTTELGVRMALGAGRGSVQWLVMREALSLIGMGLLVGLPLMFFGVRAISHLFYGITAWDGRAYGAALATLIVVAALAAYLPARRASRVDPMRALRAD